MKDPAAEQVAIVDGNNQEIGVASRGEMRRDRLRHRASFILVFNDAGEMFVMKRTLGKDLYPGLWEVAAGGVVLDGESFEESARRELAEELGILAELTFYFDFFYEDERNRVFGRIFIALHNGPFTLQPEEVADGMFLGPAEVVTYLGEKQLTPDSLPILKRIIQDGMGSTLNR
ncbi:MAG: NUDIX domain-containing protein [Proteobacteria bacterium]|nr:NUDIX domain-containing protein [Pseudomonadota bacterium]MBU1687687.1 NUDIX domain-containing protein [Pseudomonadota bacterium]